MMIVLASTVTDIFGGKSGPKQEINNCIFYYSNYIVVRSYVL